VVLVGGQARHPKMPLAGRTHHRDSHSDRQFGGQVWAECGHEVAGLSRTASGARMASTNGRAKWIVETPTVAMPHSAGVTRPIDRWASAIRHFRFLPGARPRNTCSEAFLELIHKRGVRLTCDCIAALPAAGKLLLTVRSNAGRPGVRIAPEGCRLSHRPIPRAERGDLPTAVQGFETAIPRTRPGRDEN
jgi:hypothetical protein